MKRIIINGDNNDVLPEYRHTLEETIEEVLRLVKEGYTSGFYPDWHIEEVKPKNEVQQSHTS